MCLALVNPFEKLTLLKGLAGNAGRRCFSGLAPVLALVTLLLLCTSPQSLFAQAVNGSLVGTVTDASGAVVPGAKITLTNVGTSISRTTETNGEGNYSFPNVTPATFKVTAEKAGFATAVRSNVPVGVNTTVRVDIVLQPGQVTQEVLVTAAAPLMQTETAETGRTVNTQQIDALPITGQGPSRNFQTLLTLTPGASGADYNHSRFFNPQNTLNTEVNGTSSMANNFQIEGVNDNERTGLLQVYTPAAEAIAEVNITTSNYDAEQGTALGAVVNVIYKSGSNQFHGEGYEFYKGDALNARNFFDLKTGAPFHKGHLVNNYFGGNIGGPIRKDKTFFFFNFLRTTEHTGQNQRFDVPTAAMRAGDFSDPALDPIFDPQTGDTADCLPGGVSANCGVGRTQFVASSNPADPNYNPACTLAAGCPNIIPINRIDPVAAKLVALVPLPNNNQNLSGSAKYSQNFLESTAFYQDINDYTVKIDQYQGNKDHISGHLAYMSPITYQAPAYGNAGGPANGSFEGTGTDKTYSAMINWDHTLTPTMIVQNRIGLNRYRNVAENTDYGTTSSTDIGIPGVNVSPFTSGLTGINGSGFSNNLVGYSASLPWIRSETDFDMVSNWNKIQGNHTIKFGANVIRIRDDLLQTQTFSPRGLWTFAPSESSAPGQTTNFGNNFASILLGVPSTVGRDLPIVFPAYRQWQIFLYANDKWQATPKLTVTAGLRWEFYNPATPHFAGGFSNYNPADNTLVIAGVGGNPLNLGMEKKWKDFAPRLGLAYRLTSKDVLRAGFGISYEPFEDNSYAYNYPVKQNNAFNNVSSFGPAILPDGTPATFAKGFPPPLTAAIPSDGIIPANTPLLLNQTYDVVNVHYLDPYVESWNFTYERALPHKFVLDIAYVGNHGVHLPLTYDLNAVTDPAFIGKGTAGQPLFAAFGRKASANLRFAAESSNYNSLQIKLDRHFQGGLTMTTAYTWGKALGYILENGENSNGPKYYINFRRNYARTDFDHTQTFVQSYVWSLPFGAGQRWLHEGAVSKVVGGWRFTGVLTAQTGGALDFGCNCQGINTPGNGQSPWVTGPIKKLYGVNQQLWFDTSVFKDPSVLFGKPTFGNVGRYILSGPNMFNLDASLFKNIKVTEKVNVEFRSEWFHATNNPHFNNPDVNLGDSNFGRVTGASGNRNIDFALRVMF
jgi:hypothetical protein